MAALTDATVITRQLFERTRELRRHLDGPEGDFKMMAFLAEEVAELADALATTFIEIDEVLTRSTFNQLASNAGAEPTVQASEAQPSEAERQPSRWLARLSRPARWLGRQLLDLWPILGSRAPSERPEFA
jgi:hypothetical protein